MREIVVPDYAGGSLVNLVAELEFRLTGESASPRLTKNLRATIPDADTYVLVLFDGLGSRQLDHPSATALATAHRGTIDAPFPYTTTVSLASIATGLPPSQHGLLAYHLWMEEVGHVVNTIHMTTPWGTALDLDYATILPAPNIWERLSSHGFTGVSVQPGHFDRTPLTRTLYRGATFVPYWSDAEAVERTLEAADGPGRLVLLYVPDVDFAAHIAGQKSEEYTDAMEIADTIWSHLCTNLPATVSLVGTADHGHVDIGEDNKIRLPDSSGDERILYGVERAMFIKGEGANLASDLPATWVEADSLPELWGPGPMHESFDRRRPDGILFADDNYAIFHKHSNHRLTGYHGGLMPQEREIPLLVR